MSDRNADGSVIIWIRCLELSFLTGPMPFRRLHSKLGKNRWKSETVERDRLFLRKLSVINYKDSNYLKGGRKMSILAAFMVPHPPMIIPEVGKGNENQISDTIKAYEQVADEIANLKPDTIVITSPHSVMYADYFHISPGTDALGSFGHFGAPDVSFCEHYDVDLAERICTLAEEMDFPAGTLGERDPELDHGTMVPLWFLRKKYTEGKILRIGLSGLPLSEHYRFGGILARAVQESGKRVVLIASGDLSHKLQTYGPYGYAEEGPEYDKRIMEVCAATDFGALLDFNSDFLEKAAECGHRSFVIMAGAFDGINVKAKVLSHQDVTGVGYGICSFYHGEKK